jgi:hypothetical protein
MITEDATRQSVYQQILRATNRRLEYAMPGSEGAFAHLSLGALMNLLFLVRGEWDSIGDFVTTQKALQASVGEELLWADPPKPLPRDSELVQ